MKKQLVIKEEQFKFYKNFFFKSNIFVIPSNRHKIVDQQSINKKNSNFFFLNYSLISTQDNRICDHIAIINYSKVLNYLNLDLNNEEDFILKKKFCLDIKEILILDLLLHKNSIDKKKIINLNFSNLNFDLIKILTKLKLLKYKYSSSLISKFVRGAVNMSKIFLNIFYIICFFEVKLLFLIFKKRKKYLNKFKYMQILESIPTHYDEKPYNFDLLLSDNKKIKKNEVLFVLKSKKNFFKNKFNINLKNKKKYNFFELENIFDYFKLKEIVLFYKKILKIKFFYISLVLKKLEPSFYIASEFSSKIMWEAFFYKFQISKSFCTNINPSQSSMSTLYYYTISNFIFLSSTDIIIRKKIDYSFSDAIDYFNMRYHNFYSDLISINFVKNNSNFIKNYVDIGNINSFFIFKEKNKKTYKNSLVVSIFDNSFGYRASVSSNSYSFYLQIILDILNKYSNIKFFFKTKKDYNSLKEKFNFEQKSIFEKIIAKKNLIYINNLITKPTNNSIISQSNLVVISPRSSLIYASLGALKKTVILRLDRMEDGPLCFYTKLSNIIITNKKNLCFELNKLNKKNKFKYYEKIKFLQGKSSYLNLIDHVKNSF